MKEWLGFGLLKEVGDEDEDEVGGEKNGDNNIMSISIRIIIIMGLVGGFFGLNLRLNRLLVELRDYEVVDELVKFDKVFVVKIMYIVGKE